MKLIRVALWTGSLAFPLLVVTSIDAELGTDTKGCWYVEDKPCGTPPEGKCTSQSCDISHYVENVIDTDGDGVAETTDITPVYECNGKIGYYNIKETFPVCSFVNLELEEDLLDEFVDSFGETFEDIDPVSTDFYCWQKKGCPTNGCVEITDVNNPTGPPVAVCADGPHDPVDDEASKMTSTSCRSDGDDCPQRLVVPTPDMPDSESDDHANDDTPTTSETP